MPKDIEVTPFDGDPTPPDVAPVIEIDYDEED